MTEKYSNDETIRLMNATQRWNLGAGGSRDPFDGGNYSDDEDQGEYENEFGVEVECSCWDSDLRICSECHHQRGCLEASCGCLEHFDVSVSSPAEKHSKDAAGDGDYDASRVSAQLSRATCKCDTSKKYHCPKCSHIESCHNRVTCSEYWFHFPGQQETEAGPPSDYGSNETFQSELTSRIGAYWSRQEDEQLARLFNAGWDCADIAVELRRTERSISFRLSKLCLELNGILIQPNSSETAYAKLRWTDNDDELLTTLFVNKSNLAVLAQALKLPQASIGDRLIHLRLVAIGDLDKVAYHSDADSGKPRIYAGRRPKS